MRVSERGRRPQRVHVEAGAVAGAAGARAAVAEMQRQRVGRMAGREPDRDAQRCGRPACSSTTSPLTSAEPRGGRRSDQRGVVPGQLGERLRQSPAARRCWRSGRRRRSGPHGTRLRVPAPLAWTRSRSRLAVRRRHSVGLHRHGLRRERRVRHDAVVQPRAPIRSKGERRHRSRGMAEGQRLALVRLARATGGDGPAAGGASRRGVGRRAAARGRTCCIAARSRTPGPGRSRSVRRSPMRGDDLVRRTCRRRAARSAAG